MKEEDITVSAIVAMARNRCIGKNKSLPWHIPEDLKFFKKTTMGKPIIMGRKTFESIINDFGKPLPGRTNIIVTRGDYDTDQAFVVHDIKAAIDLAKREALGQDKDEIFIGGGAQIYEQALPYTDRLYLTEIDMDVDGDTFFPDINDAAWQETSRTAYPATGTQPAFVIRALDRVNGAGV